MEAYEQRFRYGQRGRLGPASSQHLRPPFGAGPLGTIIRSTEFLAVPAIETPLDRGAASPIASTPVTAGICLTRIIRPTCRGPASRWMVDADGSPNCGDL